MSIAWIKETFGTQKPIIAMCHFDPLPGDPGAPDLCTVLD